MLKKMKRRFIASAMVAFGAVMLVLVTVINIANCYLTTKKQDNLLNIILEYDKKTFSQPGTGFPPISDMPWAGGPEAEFMTRFFIVRCDSDNNVTVISRAYISSVDEETARNYTEEILAKGKVKGYFKDYRYCVSREEGEIILVFLNASNALQFMESLLIVSVGIGIVSLLVVFLLVMILSHRAIQPYVKNIERQKRFITDAGHELKTPLTSIATSADIAAMEYEGDEWIANIQKQTARLTRLVSDLVTLSRLDEEMIIYDKTVFSLSDAAWEIAEPFASLAKAGGKTYIQNIEDRLEMEADRNSIQQLLSILLDNALKYSDEGGKIRLDIYRSHNRICMKVFNTCELQGITDLERLFDRFYRPDESRSTNTGGTGIGLSMAQAIVEAHGGKITVNSTDGKTSICTVVI